MGEHAQPPGPACHSAALLPIPTQLLHHQRGAGFREWGLGVIGDWARKGRETWEEKKEVLGMDQLWKGAWGLWELGPLGQTRILITTVSPSVWGLVGAEPRCGSSQYLLRPESPQ